MKKKYLAKLLSVALSAAMAFTSVVPSYAMEQKEVVSETSDDETEAGQEPGADDGNKGPDQSAGENEVVNETNSDNDAENGDITTGGDEKIDTDGEKGADGETLDETIEPEEEASMTAESVDGNEGEVAELNTTNDVTITVTNNDANYRIQALDKSEGTYYTFNGDTESISWDSSETFILKAVPKDGYIIDGDKDITVKYTVNGAEKDVSKNGTGYGYDVASDGSYATISVNTTVLKAYKDAESTSDKSFNITIANSSAKADTYVIDVVGTTTMGESARTVSYGGTKNINMWNFQKEGYEITGVEVYTNYGTSNAAKIADNKDADNTDTLFVRDETNHTAEVSLTSALINKGYMAGKSLTIVATTDKFNLAYESDGHDTELSYAQNGVAITKTYSIDYSNDLVATMTPPAGNTTRTFKSAKATIVYSNGTETEVSIEHGTGTTATLSSNHLKSGSYPATDVTFSFVTYENIDATTEGNLGGASVNVVAGNNNTTTKVETGKAFTFTALSTSDKTITKVGYGVGSGDTVWFSSLALDGKYTVPASATTNKISIFVTTEKNTDSVDVIKTTSTGFRIYEAKTGTEITKTDISSSSNVAGKAKNKNAYYVKIVANVGQKVKNVTYTIAEDTTSYPAAETSTEGIYEIPADRAEGYITLTVTGYTMVPVTVPTNAKAVVWYDGKAQSGSFYVRNDEDFTFTIKGATGPNDGTITINNVKYVTTGTGAETIDSGALADVSEYNVTILKENLGTGVTISAKTKEAAKASTYSVVYAPDGNSNYGWDTANSEAMVTPTSENATLYIACTDKTTLTPTLSGVDLTSLTADDVEFKTKNGGTSVIEVAKDVSDPEKPVITAKAQGNATLVYTYVMNGAEADDKNDVTYTGELDVTVKPHYEISLKAEAAGASGTEIDYILSDKTGFANISGSTNVPEYAASQKTGGYRAIVTATLKNTVTHDESVTAADVTSDGGEIGWTGASGVFVLTKGSAARNAANNETNDIGDLKAVIAATDVSNTAASINIVINEAGYTYSAARPVSLYSIDQKTYKVVPTVSVTGGADYYVTSDLGSTPIAMDATTLKNATLTYRVFEKGASLTDEEFTTAVGSATTLAAAETAGEIKDVTEDADLTLEYKANSQAVPASVLTITKNESKNGQYSVTAFDKSADNVVVTLNGTVNYQKLEANSNIVFSVAKSADYVSVPFITNDDATTITLNNTYLDTYLKSKNYKYTRGYEQSAPTNGYLVKVTKGSELTLPDSVVGLDSKRILIGWKINSSNNAIHGEGASLVNYYYMPGQTIVVDGDVTNITAIYDDRYGTVTTFRGNGTVTETESQTTYSLINNTITPATTTVTAPDNTHVWSESGATNNTFNVYAEGDEIQTVKASVFKSIQGKPADSRASYSASETINIYPGTNSSSADGYIEWKSYDGDVETDANEKATKIAAASTIINKTALANGQIKGIAAGKVQIFAVYHDSDGNTYTSTEQEIIIQARPTYAVEFKDSFPSSVELGQTVTAAETAIEVTEGGSPKLNPLASGTLTYTITGGGNIDVTTNNLTPKVTGKTLGQATVTVTYTDVNGTSVTSQTPKTVIVGASSISINITDETGAVATKTPEVVAGGTDTNLYITVTNVSDGNYVSTVTAGQLALSGGSDTITGNYTFTPGSTNSHVFRVSGTASTSKKAASEELTITYTKSATEVYTKKVTLNSYNTLTFVANKAVKCSDSQTSVDDSSKVEINGAGGETDGKNYVLKFYAKDLTDEKFSLDLTPFTANYTGTAAIEFAGWTDVVTINDEPTAAIIANKTVSQTNLDNVIKTLTEKSATGNLIIAPQFKDQSVSAISVDNDTIAIDNLEAASNKWQLVEVTEEPKSAAKIYVEPSVELSDATDGFFFLDKATSTIDRAPSSNAAYVAGTKKILLTPANALTSANKYYFAVAAKDNKVGDAKVTISAQGSDVTKEVTIKVYGHYQKDGKTYYLNSEGEVAKDTSVEVDGTTRYYDETGAMITAAGTAHDAKGQLVLLAAGNPPTRVNANGLRKSADAAGNDYFLVDGVVQTGLFDVQGTQRYANTKGVLITYAMATEDRYTDTKTGKRYGKYTDPVTTETFVIAEDGNAAERDDIRYNPVVAWTTEWPTNWSVGSATPVMKYTVNYSYAKKGGKDTTEEIEAAVTSVPENITSDTVKVTFTATTDLTGFFADKDGNKKAENKTTSVTFLLSTDGKSIPARDISDPDAGIMIVGIEEDGYDYTGSKIEPVFDVVDTAYGSDESDLYYLKKGVDYTVTFKSNKEPGTTAQIIVKGKGNYEGQAAIQYFTILDPAKKVNKEYDADLKGAKLVLGAGTYYYDGTYQYPQTLTLTLKNEAPVTYTYSSDGLYYDDDNNEIPAVVTFSNNLNKGTATILLTGLVNGTKNTTLKKTFSIKAAELATGNTKVTFEDEKTPWASKGAVPSPTVVYTPAGEDAEPITLYEGVDFTVKYAGNKAPGTTATVSITGKGNFKNTLKNVATFEVEALELADDMIKSATVYENVKASSVKVTLLDTTYDSGDVIATSKYQITVLDKDNKKLTKSDKLKAGESYTIKVTPKANVKDITGSAEKEFKVGLNLNSATIKVPSTFKKTYTGDPVTLTDEEIEKNITSTIKVGKTPMPIKVGENENFVVVGYTNNTKKGTMTVTIQGTGEEANGVIVSGTKTFKVKIVAKSIK